MSIDDDDFDLMGGSSDAGELSALLDDLKPKAAPAALPTLDPSELAPPTKPATSIAPTSIRPAVPSAEPLRTPSERAPRPDDDDPRIATYGRPGETPWQWVAYAYRAHARSTRLLERGVLLARDLRESDRLLDEAHVSLGRAVHDAADLHGLALPEAELADVRAARAAIGALASQRDEHKKKAHRDEALASARRESASASLDPVTAEQERAYERLRAAQADAEREKGALAVAEAQFAAAPNGTADELRDAGIAIDAARRAFAEAEQQVRDADVAYQDARRRALLQMSRVAEAENAVVGARGDDRRQQRELQRQQEAAQAVLRDAFRALGERVFELGLGEENVGSAFASVRRAREARTKQAATIETLRALGRDYDAEIHRKGWLVIAGIAGAVVVAMIAVAITH